MKTVPGATCTGTFAESVAALAVFAGFATFSVEDPVPTESVRTGRGGTESVRLLAAD
jgi:hypothetical protein